MAKAPKKKALSKKSPKVASQTFHEIMKASMQIKKPNNTVEVNGAREWYPLEHHVTGRTYIIRYYYEDGDNTRKCTVSLQSNNPQEPDDILITTFNYPSKQHVDFDERAKMIAIEHGNEQPPGFVM